MTDEGYEGWSNRSTWCANLWLANDEGLYRQTLEQAGEAIDENTETDEDGTDCVHEGAAARVLEEMLSQSYDELKDMAFQRGDWEGCKPNDELVTMVDDIGNGRDVDWYEIAQHWIRDELENRRYEAEKATQS